MLGLEKVDTLRDYIFGASISSKVERDYVKIAPLIVTMGVIKD